MGQRTNLVVVRDGAWRLYYDHWCANRLDVELFWGPELAIQFIEQVEPIDNMDWLDEVWCEGAAVVDLDRRVLVFFGGGNLLWDIPLRRAYLELIKQTWEGWEIRWAYEGIVTVGAYLGLPKEKFLTDYQPDGFRILTEYPEDNQTLFTAKMNGVTTVRRVWANPEALELGPGGLDLVREVEGARSLMWEGEMPTGGLHVDFDNQSMYFWWAVATPAIEERVTAAWPQWDVNWLRDQFERHIELSGLDIKLPSRSLGELPASVIENIRLSCRSEARNPARELAPMLGEAKINPSTDETRASVGEEAQKLRVLAEISQRLGLGDG